MTRVRDLSGEMLEAWQRDYSRREQVRGEIGREVTDEYSRANGVADEGERIRVINVITARAMAEGAIAAAVPGILIQEFKYAASAPRGENGENIEVKIRPINADELTDDQLEDFYKKYRVHPLYVDRNRREIETLKRRMFVAEDSQGEPAGQISIFMKGLPIRRAEIYYDESRVEAELPAETDVAALVGPEVPYVEDLAVQEGYRGSGVGKRLMLFAEDFIRWHKDSGIPQKLALAVRTDNENALRMYNGMGYELQHFHDHDNSDTFLSYNGHPHAVYLMVKCLQLSNA